LRTAAPISQPNIAILFCSIQPLSYIRPPPPYLQVNPNYVVVNATDALDRLADGRADFAAVPLAELLAAPPAGLNYVDVPLLGVAIAVAFNFCSGILLYIDIKIDIDVGLTLSPSPTFSPRHPPA